MTGPGPGKLRLDAVVEKIVGSEVTRLDAEVYLHIKGWSRARVTHLDVEAEVLNDIIVRPRDGFYTRCLYKPNAVIIIAVQALKPCVLRIREERIFPKVFRREGEAWCYVGGKVGGIFIGFRKEYIERFEAVAKELWGIEPRR